MLKFSGKKLEEIMIARGLGVQDIAVKIGRNKSSVSNWVNGVRTPNPKSRRKIAEVLGVTVSDLLTK